MWELLTCETSHQSDILHSLIFCIVIFFVNTESAAVKIVGVVWIWTHYVLHPGHFTTVVL